MSEKQNAPYGTWQSSVSAELAAAGDIRLRQVVTENGTIYWVENRPAEDGRSMIMRCTAEGIIEDMLPDGFSARNKVHEYGGGDYLVHDETIYFTNQSDQRLYSMTTGNAPIALTPAKKLRFADGTFDFTHDRMIWVQEDHTVSDLHPVNSLIGVALSDETEPAPLVSGNDFYAAPRVSPDGSHLAWLTWNQPDMPWDSCELWVGVIQTNGTITQPQKVAGGNDESICQPEWSPDGVLTFVSDRSGWWNLYQWEGTGIKALYPMDAEFGQPHWQFAFRNYAFLSENEIICAYRQNGKRTLAHLDCIIGVLSPYEQSYTEYASLHPMNASHIACLAASPTSFSAILEINAMERSQQVRYTSQAVTLDRDELSVAKSITFPTRNSQEAHGFYYAPRNTRYAADADEQPPLLVTSHGGPTSATLDTLNWKIQYWTSRGIAVLDVDYGGSVGYGKAYKDRLRGTWGVTDTEDCINGAKYLAQQGLADEQRLAITGGSAGGYTTLCALTFHKDFQVGASYYGLSDLMVFVHDTHKFEARYLDSLIGAYPEMEARYKERSPINFLDNLSTPMILLQGTEDKIVPMNQAELMASALRNRGLPVAYLLFEGEAHGFRKAENIRRGYEAELYFYGKMLGFEPADTIEPIQIENFESVYVE